MKISKLAALSLALFSAAGFSSPSEIQWIPIAKDNTASLFYNKNHKIIKQGNETLQLEMVLTELAQTGTLENGAQSNSNVTVALINCNHKSIALVKILYFKSKEPAPDEKAIAELSFDRPVVNIMNENSPLYKAFCPKFM